MRRLILGLLVVLSVAGVSEALSQTLSGKIIYLKDTGKGGRLKLDCWMIKPSEGIFKRLTSSGNCYNFAVSPDGKYFAYDYQGIWLINLESGQARKEAVVNAETLTFSPNGRVLFYYDWKQKIVFRKALGGKPEKLWRVPEDYALSEMVCSPNGQYLALLMVPTEMTEKQGIFVCNLSIKKVAQITDNWCEGVAWSPDNRGFFTNVIGVESDKITGADINRIIRFEIKGGVRVRKTTLALEVGYCSPVLSPDGKALVYDNDKGLFLYSLDGKGEKTRQLYQHPVMKVYWSPDSEWICFQYSRESKDELYIIRKDGSGLTRLIKEGFRPVWVP